jgi:hypothetical protein
MDQSSVAGIGNIYRAEILFKSGVHPEQPGFSINRTQFENIWRHSVELLQRGFETGSILTVDAAEGLGKQWSRRYIYNQSSCGRCGSAVRTWDMAARTVYACESCQPLSGELSKSRAAAHAASTPARLFVSHCAPDDHTALTPAKMTVAQLRTALEAKGAGGNGSKATLLARLLQLSKSAAEPIIVKTGTAHLQPASAAEAAAEKLRAGESAAVEHVALGDDEATCLRATAAAAKKAAVAAKRTRRALPADLTGLFPQKKRS